MTRITDFNSKATLKAALLMSGFLLFAAVMGFGQATNTINLTAAPTTTTLPDGSTLPMWGYFCGTAATGATATCAALNPASVSPTPGASTWSPVVITVPVNTTGLTSLTINLTNNLSFTPTGATTANTVPTSLMIVGQVGGGLGVVADRTTTASPSHANAQGCNTWFIASPSTPPGFPCTTLAGGTPPVQGPRVQSFGTEVEAVAATTAATCAAAGTTGTATGCATLTWSALRPGTYLLESGTHPSIQVPMGLHGILVVTEAPGATTGLTGAAGCAYGYTAAVTTTTVPPTTTPASCQVPYSAEVPLEFSEIDPVQNRAVNTAVNTANFSETLVWDGHPGKCGNPGSPVGVVNTCYPPAVNYTPFYFLINGVAFDKTNTSRSLFNATAGVTAGVPNVTGIPATGTVLVRMVNAGLHMHVPSIVGSQTAGFTGAGLATTATNPVSGFSLIAEDGNVIPGVAVATTATTAPAPRVQTDVFMAAGKTFDVMINVPAVGAPALPVYDRELSLSGNSSERDAGMLAYIGVNAAGLPVFGAGVGVGTAVAVDDTYNSLASCTVAPCTPFVVSDVSKGVIANDINVYGVQLLTPPTNGTLTSYLIPSGLNPNGTFTYTPNPGTTSDSFTYCANGAVTAATATTAATCSSGKTAKVTLGASTVKGGVTCTSPSYTSTMATYIAIRSPGVLAFCKDSANLPLTVDTTSVTATGVIMAANGGFSATSTAAGTSSFTFKAKNSMGTLSAATTVNLTFPTASGLVVNVVDGQAYANCAGDTICIAGLAKITDYRWIIEEDKTFWVDPNCTTNTSITTPGCPGVVAGTAGTTTIPTFATNFHTSHQEYVAQGCTGPQSCESGQTVYNPATQTHVPAACDVDLGVCRTTASQWTAVNPSQVHLDPTKRYYISVLPGDAANPFPASTSPSTCTGGPGGTYPSGCGHTQSGAPIPPACNILVTGCTSTSTNAFAPVTVAALPTPLPTGKLSVMVYEDDFPLNGEQDAGGGIDVLSPNEPGLGGFEIILWDAYGQLGDVTGQNTHDMFNQPLSNALAGTIDPATGLDACPISAQATADPTQAGITGRIVTCPKYESDGQTLSPLAGNAVVANLMQGKFNVQAYPAADRIARGEEWLQTNTLDGQHPHDSFIRIGEPSYFQEYGPSGYHVSIGFANPKIINDRAAAVCAGAYGPVGACNNTIKGQVVGQRMSRTPDQRLYPSGSRDAFGWTQCWVSLGDPDGEDFMFTKCDADGNFQFSGVPGGNWRLTLGDQWNDQIIDGLSTPANVSGGGTLNMGQIQVQQWQSNLYTKTYVDDNKNGIPESTELGIPFLFVNVRYRDGERANTLLTDFNGVANFNETFPLFNWYTVETDPTRYKTTGIHVVYDAGGPADGTSACGGVNAPCGTSPDYKFLANTYERVPLPADLSVPGAVYCKAADCKTEAASFAAGTAIPSSPTAGLSTGRIDPSWVDTEAWSGLIGQGNWIEFGKAPYAACNPALPVSLTNFCATVTTTVPGSTTSVTTKVGENGGISGNVVYGSTRPFDDASLTVQQPWEPLVPHVTINLYQEGFAADGVTPTLTLVDTTQTSSWDDWAQGFYPGSTAGTGTGAGQKPYMSCPGQMRAPTSTAAGAPGDLFFYSLNDQPNYLDFYNSQHNGGTLHTLPYNSQFKCYDAMHVWNQVQPAPYDGHYSFPSVLGINPTTGKPITPTGVTAGVGTGTNFVASKMAGTNCTICVANPDTTDHYRSGLPMLPPGKYVVEVVPPPGYEIEKEEDKNLLIGDQYIAPATQEFAGLGGSIFILPDQASVASLYDPSGSGYNPTNYQNSTTAMGMSQENQPAPGILEPVWPCVGQQRIVPDYLSLFPQAKEVAPFAGATRPLCDRKEVALQDQMGAIAKFVLFTSTHIASQFTGVITDDFTSEFDPFSPQFGEKFAPPNMPVSTRDYLGNEISRVYSDHFGIFDGLTYSSWEVDPPNITGYSPTMMVQCMNDYGPIIDRRATINGAANPTFGKLINDPLYNQAYSDFCYELPYMPGNTTYLDTPVVPTQAFVGAGYNNPDCAYPDATPAIAEVDSQDGIGPWVSQAGHTLTITALGNATVANASTCTVASTAADVSVNNAGYAGPSATASPFNCKTVTRHYGFGARGAASKVTIGGANAIISSWSDTTITVVVPGGLPGQPSPIPACPIQQQAQYGGSPARCGQLVITAANGKQSVDAVTVTVGGKGPTHVAASGTIQSAIDAAAPGDLIIVDPTCSTTAGATAPCTTPSATNIHGPASHTEMVIMWKPVRLQGVGAATTIINANTHPAGKLLDPWRRHINCFFGLSLQGAPYGNKNLYDPTTTYSCPDTSGGPWNYFTAQGETVNLSTGAVTTGSNPQIDRLPLEATVGWTASLNGNLGELLQEPSLMGAYEGAGITVLGKGLEFHGQDPWNDGLEAGAFPTVTSLLTGVVSHPDANGGVGSLLLGDANPLCHTVSYSATGAVTGITSQTNPYPSNYICNPSSIDGLTITNSSQGGGGIFVHGWAHYLQIANNRIYNNAGTLSGGISVGQGEFALPYIQGGATNAAPGSCSDGTGFVTNQHLPMCLQLHVGVHNNMITDNSAIGDELFSATLSGGGGATVCTGNDYYKFNYNWVCGNVSAGEGGGMVHLGEIFNGDIEHNSFVFNESSNPTIPTNGGGIQVQGTPDTDPTCPGIADADCPPGLSDGTGPGLVINANLIQGNSADSGSGGGIRLQQVDGTEVATFRNPGTCVDQTHCLWNVVSITNNIIVNNLAGWDGAGISLQDALAVNIINNTIAHNDTLATSGVLTNSIGTPLASAPPGSCVNAAGTASCPQSSGVTSMPHSSLMTATFAGPPAVTLTCPAGRDNCQGFSNPILFNDVFWQNRAFYAGIAGPGTGTLSQQNMVSLFNASGSLAATQATTGACPAGASYWDLGVRGDRTTSPNSGSGFSLNPQWSIVTAGYTGGGSHNTGQFTPQAQYCNGSRVPPECTTAQGCGGLHGFGTPPGIADSLTPNPVFSFVPSATVDEGNNWLNVSWGPLSLTNPSVTGGAYGNYGGGPLLGNYAPVGNTPAGTSSLFGVAAPTTDFFGNPRTGQPHKGAVQ